MQSLTVYKQADGRYRWLGITSTAYQDRDQEFVTVKALAADVARADGDGDYGPLWWWHIPVVLGGCDFNAMSGPLLFESGTFRDSRIGKAFAAQQDDLEFSIGFNHLAGEPGPDGAYSYIRRVERSLLPRGRASNLFTSLLIQERPMDADKIKELASRLNIPDQEIAALVEHQQMATAEQAKAVGVRFKEAQPPVPGSMFVWTGAAFVPVAGVAKEAESSPAPAPVADVTPPLVAPLTEPTPPAGITQQQLQEFGAGMAKAIVDMLTPLLSAQATKSAADSTAQQQQLAQLQQSLKATEGRVAALYGDLPVASLQQLRASQSDATIVPETRGKELGAPVKDPANPIDDFMSGFGFKA